MVTITVEQVKALIMQGLSHAEAAAKLGVSEGWVALLAGADGFRLVKGDGDGSDSEAEDGRDAGEVGEHQAGEGEGGEGEGIEGTT